MLQRPGDCPQAQTLYGIPFLCLCCSFMYCMCPLVACCRLSRGGRMLKCVWQNNIFDVACNLLIMPIKATNLPAGRICIYYIVMQPYTLYLPSTYALTEWSNGEAKTNCIFHGSCEVFFLRRGSINYNTNKHHINIVTSCLYRVDTMF